jgi:hypothetical protein
MKNLIYMGEMGWPWFTIYENIIKENEHKVTEERMKDVIHDNFKSGGRITKTKGHDQELIVALMSAKCHIGDVFIFHMYPVVAITKFKFGKVLNPT